MRGASGDGILLVSISSGRNRMKKRSLVRLVTILAAALALLATACPDPNGPGGEDDAVVSPTEYTITYNLNHGMNASANPSTYKTDATVTLAAPTRSARVFAGWYESAGFNGSAVTSFPAGTTGDKVLYAKWSWASYAAGDAGPAGGKIVYVRPDGECDANAADGAANAWKYVESAPTVITGKKPWSAVITTAVGCTPNWLAMTYNSTFHVYQATSSDTPTTFVSGAENTDMIVATWPTDDTAAKACLDYSVTVGEISIEDWYLPSIEELCYVMKNSTQSSGFYWSSSECSSETAKYALTLNNIGNGYQGEQKNGVSSVIPVRHF